MKKVIALCLIALFGLAGCNSNNDMKVDVGQSNPTQTPTSQTISEQPKTEAVETIKPVETAPLPTIKMSLAQCLTGRGVKMYGASWCSHCKAQKELFGDSFKDIQYVECDQNTPGNNFQACIKANIQNYPTWIIPGVGALEGEQELDQLAALSNCR